MSAAAVSPPVVDPAAVSPPAAVDTPTTIPASTTIPAPTEATAKTPTTLEKFVGENIPRYKQDISRYKEETQSDDDKAFKQEQDKKKQKIEEDIEKIRSDADEKYKELSAKYKIAKNNYDKDKSINNEKELDKISADIDALYADTLTKLGAIQKDLDGDTTPIPVKAAESLFFFVLNKIKAAFKKSQLKAQALHVAEDTMDILVEKAEEMNQDIKNGKEVNIANISAIADLANKIAAANAPPPTPSSPGPSLLESAASAAKALTKGKIPDTAGADPAAAATTTPAPIAVAAGGGISRKRSHPKYINQISENRNKIFKKELEIINSIRRFHRSHTIRKRDKINSILGFKKSKNNRNFGNTRRHHHKHRHNNHKHKSAKHIKKVM